MPVNVFTNLACDALSKLANSVPHLYTAHSMIHFEIVDNLLMWQIFVE